jgi:uncharacterized membrane protein YebE (DUF533 family)
MIDPTRILTSVLASAMGGGLNARPSGYMDLKRMKGARRLLTNNKALAGIGLAGAAWAAYELWKRSQAKDSVQSVAAAESAPPTLPLMPTEQLPPVPTPRPYVPPPLPPLGGHTDTALTPPQFASGDAIAAIQGTGAEAPQALEPPPLGEEALLLVRAMISAASADHVIDKDERSAIYQQAMIAGLGIEERSFLDAELANPWSRAQIAAEARRLGLKEQVFVVSAVATDNDSQAERDHLDELGEALGLTEDEIRQLKAALGIGAGG